MYDFFAHIQSNQQDDPMRIADRTVFQLACCIYAAHHQLTLAQQAADKLNQQLIVTQSMPDASVENIELSRATVLDQLKTECAKAQVLVEYQRQQYLSLCQTLATIKPKYHELNQQTKTARYSKLVYKLRKSPDYLYPIVIIMALVIVYVTTSLYSSAPNGQLELNQVIGIGLSICIWLFLFGFYFYIAGNSLFEHESRTANISSLFELSETELIEAVPEMLRRHAIYADPDTYCNHQFCTLIQTDCKLPQSA